MITQGSHQHFISTKLFCPLLFLYQKDKSSIEYENITIGKKGYILYTVLKRS